MTQSSKTAGAARPAGPRASRRARPRLARVAIVTTLRNTGPSLRSFVAYHLATGFEKLYLYFDDPTDPDLASVANVPGVVAIPCDATVRAAWETTRVFADMGPHVDSEVMARQTLNAELALGRAQADGIEWLLHLDADELFHAATESSAVFFGRLSRRDVQTVAFLNREALVHDPAVLDGFQQLTLFKESPAVLAQDGGRKTAARGRAIASVPQLAAAYFLAYGYGKGAVRVGPAVVPFGVHRFRREDQVFALGDWPEEVPVYYEPCVLHYPCAGFEAFWNKYRTLGRFADHWFKRPDRDIARMIGTFHLEARDVVGRGDRDDALRFFLERAVVSDSRTWKRLERLGVLLEIDAPQKLLARLALGPPAR